MFNAEISAGSLLLPESRRIARLLLTQPTPKARDAAPYQDNLLQKTPSAATLSSRHREVQRTNVASFVRANCKDDYRLAWAFFYGY